MYFAIIADIIESRTIMNRFQVQEQLNRILQEINSEFDEYIAARFLVTLGDEFQGLLNSTQPILQIIERIILQMYPIRIRFGIGFGEINTRINKEMAIGADGTAYHYARRMINELKKNQRSRMSDQPLIKVLSDKNESIIKLVNNTFSLWSFIQEKWTEKQVRLISETIASGNNQREAAKRLGVVQSTVQRGLKSSGYYNYLQTKRTLEEVLVKEWG